MIDDAGLPTPEPQDSPSPNTSKKWDAVLERMNDLSTAVADWVKAAADEPDTKEKVGQVRAGIDDIALRADAALGRAMRSQAGQAVGDAAQAVTDVAAPHVKALFTELADIFGKAAEKVDEATRTPAETAPETHKKPPASKLE